MRTEHEVRQGARPRVIHVTTAHRADDVRIFDRECRSLAASGRYEVYLAASGEIPPGSGVTLIPLTPPPSGRARRFSTGPRKASALKRAMDADVWHFHDPELLPVALKLARRGQAVIWDAHEDYTEQFSGTGAKQWIPRPARRIVKVGTKALLSRVDRHAAAVIAATPTIATRYSNPRTVVVGNEARLETFGACRPDFVSRQLLFTGSASAEHLFEAVVEAVALVPDARLAVAGREPDQAVWSRAKTRLGGRLIHLGWLDRSELAGAMSSSALGLLTYADTAAYALASPTKGFEFAAAGVPVVATPNQLSADQLSRSGAGFVATDFSSSALAEAIAAALSDESAWLAASSAGRAWAAKEGSWGASEKRLLDLYGEIAGCGAGDASRRMVQ